MRQKIVLAVLILGCLGVGAGLGGVGYLGYRWITSPQTISNTETMTPDEKAAEEPKWMKEERERIAAMNGLVQRIDADNLMLKLTDGSEITLTNGNKCGGDGTELEYSNCYGYVFYGHDEIAHGYFVLIGFYESQAYQWVDDRTGEITRIWDFPHLSQSRNRFVSVAATESEGQNGIQIWDLTSGKPVKEWEYSPTEYALYEFVDWEDEDTVNLSVFTYPQRDDKNPESNKPITLPVKLLRLPEWHIEGLPSSPKNGE
ncbi:MAG: hypothetical protein ORN98_05140 [Alphaproteobacteria bacterium]|nr:hypothetical protein [Alphaproteobacteria bacterium]